MMLNMNNMKYFVYYIATHFYKFNLCDDFLNCFVISCSNNNTKIY